MIKDNIEILKYPLAYRYGEVMNAILDVHDGINESIYYTDGWIEVGEEGWWAIVLSKDKGMTLNFYLSRFTEGGEELALDKYFKYPLLPTEDERTLFEIEFGIQYPLKSNKIAESYLNSNIYR